MNDFEFNRMFEKLETASWKESAFGNVDWYYCEEGLYAIRVDKGKPEEKKKRKRMERMSAVLLVL